jgi:dUTP pyrophosphatase
MSSSNSSDANVNFNPEISSPELLIKRLYEDARLPTKGSKYAAGWDLYAAAPTFIEPGSRGLVKTGISIRVPYGCYGRVAPRSGLALKNGITVGAGVIDYDYNGEVGVLLFNHSDKTFLVQVGERVAQLVLEKIEPDAVVREVSDLPSTERGSGGFGSTGV